MSKLYTVYSTQGQFMICADDFDLNSDAELIFIHKKQKCACFASGQWTCVLDTTPTEVQ